MSSERRGQGRGRGSKHGSQPRTVLVSKALSRLLRHAAVEERIPIDSHGYVRMDHLLDWQRLRNMKPAVTFGEVVEVVQDNEKKRFALKYTGENGITSDNTFGSAPTQAQSPTTQAEAEVATSPVTESAKTEPPTEAESESETHRAISIYQSIQSTNNQDLDPRQFFIRATQGHSMKTIEAESLLTPITLDDLSSIPDTVVHGTFYGAWSQILQSGGLKRMSRNHVHFATGPALHEVLPPSANGSGEQGINTSTVDSVLGKNKVISGMRGDAQILIYIDIRKALTERPDMKWWRSENGVILTEGVSTSATSDSSPDVLVSEHKDGQAEEGEHQSEEKAGQQGKESKKERAKAKEDEKLVPIEYWLAAVEIKEGLGLLWKHGEGIVRELPEHLRSRALPFGKRGHGHGHGRGGGKGRGRGRG